jgi:aspartate/methionine/tyrosine aminotransferase
MDEKINLSTRGLIPTSPIRQISQLVGSINARRMRMGLNRVIDLSIGQPHLKPNHIVLSFLAQLLNDNDQCFGYSASEGEQETLAVIAQLFNYYFKNLHYSTEEVMITNGASQALWNAFSIFLEPGTTAVTFAPYFSTYKGQVESLGSKLIPISTRKTQFRPDIEALHNELAKNPTIKLVLLNYPNNPSGITLNKGEAYQLGLLLKKFPHIAIVLDEVYRDLSFEGYVSLLDIVPELKERTIVINSGAKTLAGAPGLRIGVVAAPTCWIKAMSIQQLYCTAGVNTLTQKAAIFAIRSQIENLTWLQKIKREYQNNVYNVYEELQKNGLATSQKPEGAFYVLMDASALIGKKIPSVFRIEDNRKCFEFVAKDILGSSIETDHDIVRILLYVSGVSTVPGSGFGLGEAEGIVRISCAQDLILLQQAVHKMCTTIRWLKADCVYELKFDDFDLNPSLTSIASQLNTLNIL